MVINELQCNWYSINVCTRSFKRAHSDCHLRGGGGGMEIHTHGQYLICRSSTFHVWSSVHPSGYRMWTACLTMWQNSIPYFQTLNIKVMLYVKGSTNNYMNHMFTRSIEFILKYIDLLDDRIWIARQPEQWNNLNFLVLNCATDCTLNWTKRRIEEPIIVQYAVSIRYHFTHQANASVGHSECLRH